MFAKAFLAICGFVASTVAMALPSPQYVNVGGLNVAYYESTGTHGPGVLLVNGNSTSAKSFSDLLDFPFAKLVHVVIMELPGTGNSQFDSVHPETSYSVSGLAHTIDGVANALHMEHGVIAGWSAGGNTLLQGVGEGLYAQAAGILIWGAPPVKNPFNPESFLPLPAFAYAFTPVVTQQQAQDLANAFLRPNQVAPQFFVDDILNTDPNFRAYLGQSLFTGQYLDQTQIVANMTQPLAIVQGAEEQVANLDYMQTLSYSTLWRNEIQVVPAAGHATHYERPFLFNRLMRQFYLDVVH